MEKIIDCIAPFFPKNSGKQNWSKINFALFQKRIKEPSFKKDLQVYLKNIKNIGYTAVTLDDVQHIVKFKTEYKPILTEIKKHNLKLYINSDFSYHEKKLSLKEKISKFQKDIEKLPEHNGLIVRIGESDGQDLNSKGHIAIKTIKQARFFLETILTKYHKPFIFRTWTLGMYQIGDMIWNKVTIAKLTKGFEDTNLIFSIKHGPGDFFRHLPVNKTLNNLNVPFIVELQARREYEGAGEYPAYIGEDTQKLLPTMKKAYGVQVWVQTGGWTDFDKRSFIDNVIWNEINAYTISKLIDNQPLRKIQKELATKLHCKQLPRILELSEQAVKDGLYIKELANELYIKRFRIPPNLPCFWNMIVVNEIMKTLLKILIKNKKEVIKRSFRAVEIVEAIEKLSNINVGRMKETFTSVAYAKEYLLTNKKEFISSQKTLYDSRKHTAAVLAIKTIFPFCLRKRAKYRIKDRLLVHRLFIPLIRRFATRHVPKELHVGTRVSDFLK